MAKTNLLHPSDRFPTLTVALPGGRTLRLPDALAGHFGVILFYRGSWCPYCNAQLTAFQRSLGRLAHVDVSVVALSVDDEATTQALIAHHGLQFPIGHSADARAIPAATGRLVPDDIIGLARYLHDHARASQPQQTAPNPRHTRRPPHAANPSPFRTGTATTGPGHPAKGLS